MISALAFASSVILLGQASAVDLGTKWIGAKAKSEKVNDENGKEVDLSKLFGKRPVVLVFYRAIW